MMMNMTVGAEEIHPNKNITYHMLSCFVKMHVLHE